MKKLFSIFLSGLAIASTTLSFQSCADEYDPAIVTKHDMAVNEYTENFIKHYGDIDPNHTWGFTTLNPSIASTRAVTRGGSENGAGDVDTKRNMWSLEGNDRSNLFGRINIPGYPNFDDRYYVDGSIRGLKESRTPGENPAGDVTEQEIQFVSYYFRSHTFEQMRPDMVKLHLTDFFVQNVCGDADQEAYTDGEGVYHEAYPNGKNIGNGITWGMDRLMFKTMDSHDIIDETWTHVNNFNAGSTNFDPENQTGDNPNPQRTIMYITSSGTEDFAYHPSWGTADPGYYDNWVLVRLTWQEVGADGNTHTREGYYLAFDFEAENAGRKVDPDGYYSNWIIKITPAHPEDSDKTKRVMCEDLGNTYDFDFNDVVFDVTYETAGGQTQAIINLQAAGGTMPIYVGKTPSPENAAYEAHNLLGNPSSNPVNVGTGARHTIANYRIPVTSTNPEDIPIYVVSSTNTANHTSWSTYQIDGPSKKGESKAPQKFCVPNSVKWMKECQFIEWGYAKFKDWVQQESGNEDWYKTITDPDKIYTAPAVIQGTQGNGDGSGYDRVNPLTSRKTVTLSVNEACSSMGTVYGAGSYIPGKQVKITAAHNAGYQFAKWVNKKTGAVITTNPFIFTMDSEDMEFEAYFENQTEDPELGWEAAIVTDQNNVSIDFSRYIPNSGENDDYEITIKLFINGLGEYDKTVNGAFLYGNNLQKGFNCQNPDNGIWVTINSSDIPSYSDLDGILKMSFYNGGKAIQSAWIKFTKKQ